MYVNLFGNMQGVVKIVLTQCILIVVICGVCEIKAKQINEFMYIEV